MKFAKAGSYTVELSLVDKAVNDRVLTTFTQTAAVNPAFTVTATVSMQGRIDRAGVEMTLTGLTERPFAYGPFTATSEDRLSSNLSFAPVVDGEYEITTNQARYLNVSGKTVTISAGKQSLNQLQLKGGNAVQDDVININDASLIANQYGYKGIEYDGDVNFSGEVDIFDLAMVGGNFDLTAAAAYADWTP